VHTAAEPLAAEQSVRELYSWLGVAAEPRWKDIIARVLALVAAPPTDTSRAGVTGIYAYLADTWSLRAAEYRAKLTSLRRTAWLPARGRPAQWFAPNVLYATFRDYLFDTQAAFLDIPPRIQQQTRGPDGLLAFLRVPTEPSVKLVADHLKLCAERGTPVNKEVYRFLHEHHQDPAIAALEATPCLLLPTGSYVSPSHCFWGTHPFGKYRYQLGAEWRGFTELFQRLGVREKPAFPDYAAVLQDLAPEQRDFHRPISDEDRCVVSACWAALDTMLQTGELSPDDLAGLSQAQVIPNAQGALYTPATLFFEDRTGLAARFGDYLSQQIIPRNAATWRAMHAAGVRALSDAVTVALVEPTDDIEDQLLSGRVARRRPLIARVADVASTTGADGRLAALDQLSFRRAQRIVAQFTFTGFGRPVDSPREDLGLLLLDHTLYAVYDGTNAPWGAVAREIARTLDPSGEAPTLASAIKEALSAATSEEASRNLDELGYPPLMDSGVTTTPESAAIQQIGGTEQQELPAPTPAPAEVPVVITDAASTFLGKDAHDRPGFDTPEVPPTATEHPDDTTPGAKGGGRPQKPERRVGGKLRTYVILAQEGQAEPSDPEAAQRLSEVERAGVNWAMDYERQQGRIPQEQDHYHPGYDIVSTDANGQVRYIEVKALSGAWSERNPAALTRPEFQAARQLGEQSWLYVLEYATSERAKGYLIQDPANRVDQFLYDFGWQAASSSAEHGQTSASHPADRVIPPVMGDV